MAKKSYGEWMRSNPALPTKEYQKKHMAQQTAVECFIKELRQLALNTSHHLGMGDIRLTQGMLDDFEEKYKEIEKEQIVNAHLTGLIYPLETDASLQAEEYYEQTFKK